MSSHRWHYNAQSFPFYFEHNQQIRKFISIHLVSCQFVSAVRLVSDRLTFSINVPFIQCSLSHRFSLLIPPFSVSYFWGNSSNSWAVHTTSVLFRLFVKVLDFKGIPESNLKVIVFWVIWTCTIVFFVHWLWRCDASRVWWVFAMSFWDHWWFSKVVWVHPPTLSQLGFRFTPSFSVTNSTSN